jgi:Ni/Co efflux regulator RcnB
MKYKSLLVCIAALAVAAASTAAQAAKPASKERQEAIAKIKQNHRNVKTPKTVAEAERTKVVLANGATAVAVPLELWNELSVQPDAQGRMQVREADGTAVAASTVEVEAHE